MVSRIPGSSTGCGTCRARKIKCDEGKPGCQKCLKSGRHCKGYRSPSKFVNTFGQLAKTARTESHSQGNLKAWKNKTVLPSNLKRNENTNHSSESSETSPPPESTSNTMSLREMNNCGATRWQFIAWFIESYLPMRDDIICGNWSTTWPDLFGRNDGLDASLYGLCMTLLGRSQRNCAMTHESYVHYAQGVSALSLRARGANMKISRGEDINITEEHIVMTAALMNFEMFNPTSRLGWASHMLALTELLRQYGPPSPNRPMDPSLWQMVRWHSLGISIAERKSSFLASPAWKGVSMPWATHPLINELLDIAVDLPGVLEQVDSCTQTKFADDQGSITSMEDETLRHILDSCLTLNQNLKQWKVELQKSAPEPLEYQIATPLDALSLEIGDTFLTGLAFPTILVGKMYCHYWALQIVLQDAIANLTQFINQGKPTMYQYSAMLDAQDTADLYANNICQSVSYLTSAEFGTMGTQSTAWPLIVAQKHFGSRTHVEDEVRAKHQWCGERVEELIEHGYTWARTFSLIEKENYAVTGDLGQHITQHMQC